MSSDRLENVFAPLQPPKRCPTVIVVTLCSADTVNAIEAPCKVVPLHSPVKLLAGGSGAVGFPSLHAAAEIPTMSISTRESAIPIS